MPLLGWKLLPTQPLWTFGPLGRDMIVQHFVALSLGTMVLWRAYEL